MNATTRVDLHCHSVYSDGALTPREIAELLVAGGAAAASLVDHDCVDGLDEFNQTLAQHEIGYISGVEITTQYRGEEVHLLAYGFDPAHPELRAVLLSLRQARAPGVQSIAESIRGKGTITPGDAGSAAPDGRIDIADAIALVHRAGGRAFLAHPLVLQPDDEKLETPLIALKAQGLDGIEAFYEAYTDEQRRRLCELAQRLGLLVSAGTDMHDRKAWSHATVGIEMPTDLWKEFRDAVCTESSLAPHSVPAISVIRPRQHYKWRNFVFHFVFPTFLAIALFVTAIYAVFLPAFERSLLDRKREMIRELTNSAWSILASYERDERAGKLTRTQAQAMAISRVETLRYGRESKDYFWLQDTHPHIVMHPYRRDLNGKDVTNFRDPRGVPIFVEFADLVKRGREGYIDYVWQWKDDSSRLVPKESYIKGFQPWGWIIGTGIYIEDVRQEIARVEQSLVRTALGISVVVILLLLYVMRQSLRLERQRAGAEENLHESAERYRSLVEATTEGTLLVMDGRCRYANPIFLEMLGCTGQELKLLDLSDLFPKVKDNERVWDSLHRLLQGDEAVEGVDGVLRRRDGTLIECVLIPSRISFADRSGLIILTRQISPSLGSGQMGDMSESRWRHLQQVVEGVPIGLFRARLTARGTLVEYNRAAARLFVRPGMPANAPVTLAEFFNDAVVYEEFLADLQREGAAERRLQLSSLDPGTRTVALSAVLVRDEHGSPHYIDGVVEDITRQEKRAAELESEVEKMSASLLFLHQPVSRFRRSAVFCKLETPIHAAAAMMTAQQSSAALVQAESGDIVGIVTDRDIRERAVAVDVDRKGPVYRIMTSPLVTISERAEIYEALLHMEQQGVQHLAVADESGRIVGTISNQVLLQFQHYGPMVLAREVEQAATPEDVVRCCRRAPGLARVLLDCGAQQHHVTRMISSVCDAATVRLIALAEKELGPAPVPYVFLALGSHGRQEMTLSSDQDNAILYEAPRDPAELPCVEAYLNALGKYVCEGLDQAGYPLCHGNVMARNARWCQPISVWKQYFTDWIRLPEPQQLLEFAIFFDFRPVYGTAELSYELRRHVFEVLRSHPPFFPHLAQHSLLFKPPLRLFGRILVGGAGGDHSGLLDLKDALMPIVSFTRLYTLRGELDDTRTLDRLKALVEADILPESSAQEITAAYDFLMRLRLQHQAADLTSGQVVDNIINTRRLGPFEETQLNHSFAQIAAIQKRLSYDFLGGTS